MEIVRSLDLSPEAPNEARHALDLLAAALPAPLLDQSVLVVSELVTNAVLHGDGPSVDVRIEVAEEFVRIEVHDWGPGFTPSDALDPGESGGRGLLIVDRLADRWGVERNGTNVVWAEFDWDRYRSR
jgi:anti-sigma regulatory factor (Ser/Thr protein kinase)